MNVQTLKLKLNDWNHDLKEVWNKFRHRDPSEAAAQKRVMTQEEMLDESLRESFPASDPPGHFSTSAEDKQLH